MLKGGRFSAPFSGRFPFASRKCSGLRVDIVADAFFDETCLAFFFAICAGCLRCGSHTQNGEKSYEYKRCQEIHRFHPLHATPPMSRLFNKDSGP